MQPQPRKERPRWPKTFSISTPGPACPGDMTLAALLDAGGPDAGARAARGGAVAGPEGRRRWTSSARPNGASPAPGCDVRAEQSPPLRHLQRDAGGHRPGGGIGRGEGAGAGGGRRGWPRWRPVSTVARWTRSTSTRWGRRTRWWTSSGAFVLVEALGVDKVYVGTIPVGGGTVEIAHGRMGVPAPATAALLAGYQAVGGPEMRELTTPDRRSLGGPVGRQPRPAAGHDGEDRRLRRRDHEAARAGRTCCGWCWERRSRPGGSGGTAAGRRDARGAGARRRRQRTVVELQTNIDDVSPEVIGYTLRPAARGGRPRRLDRRRPR